MNADNANRVKVKKVLIALVLSRAREYEKHLSLRCSITVKGNINEKQVYPLKYQIGDSIEEPNIRSLYKEKEWKEEIYNQVTQDTNVVLYSRVPSKFLLCQTKMYELPIVPKTFISKKEPGDDNNFNQDMTKWDLVNRSFTDYVKLKDDLLNWTVYGTVEREDIDSKTGSCAGITVRIYKLDLARNRILKFLLPYLALWALIIIAYYSEVSEASFFQIVSASLISLVVSAGRMVNDEQIQESVFFTIGMALIIATGLANSISFMLFLPAAMPILIVFSIAIQYIRFTLAKAKAQSSQKKEAEELAAVTSSLQSSNTVV